MKPGRVARSAAAALLAVGPWLVAPACLNPRPEELPSQTRAPGASGFPGDANGVDRPPEPGTSLEESPGAAPSPDEGGSVTIPDADDPGVTADAGAPDAGVRALSTGGNAEPEPDAADPPE